MKNRGHFITFEGGEGCGKTSVIDAIHARLLADGLDAIQVREPGGTELGEALRKLVLNGPDIVCDRAEVMLFLAARAQHVEERLLPLLKEGKIILCDRFNDSTIVYQGFSRGLDVKDVSRMCDFVSQELVIDKTVFLDVDPKIGLQRIKKSEDSSFDRIEKAKLEFHEKVRTGYQKQAKDNPNRFIVIDAADPLDVVIKNTYNSLKPIFN